MATYLTLRSGCKVYPVGMDANALEYIVRTPDNRLYKLSPGSHAIFSELEMGRSLEEVCDRLSPRYPGATSQELQECLVDMYRPLLRDMDAQEGEQDLTEQSVWKRRPLLVQITLVSERWVRVVSGGLTWLYRPVAAMAMLAMVIAAHVLLYAGTAGSVRSVLGASTMVTLVLCVLSVIAHELGHAAALRRGGTPGGIGIGMFLLMPVFFADVSQVWGLPRRARIEVDLGGVYFQQIVFAIFAVLGSITHIQSFRAACLGIDVMCLIAVNPAFRFDGYWVLVDWLEIPRLHSIAQDFLKRLFLAVMLGRGAGQALLPVGLSGVRSLVFVLYAFLGNAFLLVVVLLNLRSVRASLRGAVIAVPRVFHELIFAWRTHDWIAVANSGVSLWFICAVAVALLGMSGLYIYRAARALQQWCSVRLFPRINRRINPLGDIQ